MKAHFSADVGGAGGYVLFISIASFILWYRPIYLGFNRTDGKVMAFFFCKSPQLLGLARHNCATTADRPDIYFLFAGFHLLFSIYMTIGIPCKFAFLY